MAGKAVAEPHVARFSDEAVVLDAHAEILFGNVDTRFNGDDHAGLERCAMFPGVVNVQADVMAQAVDEIGPEGFAVKAFSVGIHVIVSNFLYAPPTLVP